MFCSKCGAQAPENTAFCSSCGNAMNPAANTAAPVVHPHIPSNLGLAIFSTLCCCLPFGIVAIIFATQVSSHIAAGNYDAARKSAENAKTWSIISIVLGLVGSGLLVILQFAAAAAATEASYY